MWFAGQSDISIERHWPAKVGARPVALESKPGPKERPKEQRGALHLTDVGTFGKEMTQLSRRRADRQECCRPQSQRIRRNVARLVRQVPRDHVSELGV